MASCAKQQLFAKNASLCPIEHTSATFSYWVFVHGLIPCSSL